MTTQLDLFDVGQRKKPPSYAGTPAKPGTGPKGWTCRDCIHRMRFTRSKTWSKCYKAKRAWTGGRATDIKVSWPACLKFEVNPERIPARLKRLARE